LPLIRGVPIFRWKNRRLDRNPAISNGGFTVEMIAGQYKSLSVDSIFKDRGGQYKSVSGDLIFKDRGLYEWNVVAEKLGQKVYIGICGINEDFNKIGQNFFGWVLGSDGYVYHNKEWKWYDAKIKEGDKVTVHLDMKKRTCAFSINGDDRKPIVSEWKDIPSQVYPIVSLSDGKLRMEPVKFDPKE